MLVETGIRVDGSGLKVCGNKGFAADGGDSGCAGLGPFTLVVVGAQEEMARRRLNNTSGHGKPLFVTRRKIRVTVSAIEVLVSLEG